MLALGLLLNHVVAMVTHNAARMAGLEGELGTLSVGAVADVTVLADDRGPWRRRDYNEVRPHSSIGRIPPARFAEQHRRHAGGAAHQTPAANEIT